ncbi:hypothetical protein ACHAWO_008953 [Cyclotella atomus]|uniref:Signal recognition particle subunit SRP68 n=1 Tax=Cyclotella atomus TaxID=382360 RepID=A0ABD3QHX3_9STRA
MKPLRIHLHSSLQRSPTDYAAYASYCTRRLQRLRHSKPVKKDLLHIKQYKSSLGTRVEAEGSGKGSKAKHAYRSIDMKNFPSEILAGHENYFLEPLYCSERAWAQSMAIKEEERNPSVGDGKKKSRSKLRADRIKRMKKAVSYAVLLEELTASTKGMPVEEGDEEKAADVPVDEHTRMEAKAYASWMRGNLAMEQEDWKTACDEYQSAFTLCESIAGSTNSSGDGSDENKMQQLELQDFFTTRANNVIAPLLRYCMYELQERGVVTNTNIGGMSKSLQSSAASGSSTIEFRENSIAVETKDLKMALLKVSDLKKEWEDEQTSNKGSADDAKFMALLNGYDDVISLVNQESKQLANLKAGPAVNAKKFQFVNIMGYAKYQKLKLVMERNEDMVNGILKRRGKKVEAELKHWEEAAHLYDALLQDARAVASLPGGGSVENFAGDAFSDVEDEFLLEANANVLRLRSLRCYYLAKMHASPLVGKYSHAVALLDQAETLAREALEEIGACDQMERRDEILENLETVVKKIKGEKCRVFSMSYLSKSGTSKSSLPLLARLHDYDIPADPTYITDVPPKLEPIACKPSFFDVALNYVSDYPVDQLEQVLETHGEKAGASTGLLGWFRR